MSIELTQEEKDLIKKNKLYIIGGDWDGFFNEITIPKYTTVNPIFQFCLECVPDLLYKITAIPDYAFGHSNTKSVNIPSSIKEIKEHAFWDCENLESVTIPDSVTKIGEYAFLGCDSLKSVDIPDSVTEIGNNVFYGCDSLKHISISKHLEGKDFLEDLPKDCEIEVRS